MKHAFRLIWRLTAAMALVVGTMQLAYASGQTPAVGQMVLCTGQGAVTVAVDADGNPTGQLLYCPKCAATALHAVAVTPPAPPPLRVVVSETLRLQARITPAHRTTLDIRARGPPVCV